MSRTARLAKGSPRHPQLILNVDRRWAMGLQELRFRIHVLIINLETKKTRKINFTDCVSKHGQRREIYIDLTF